MSLHIWNPVRYNRIALIMTPPLPPSIAPEPSPPAQEPQPARMFPLGEVRVAENFATFTIAQIKPMLAHIATGLGLPAGSIHAWDVS